MKITRACDYAMRALIFMARKPVGTTFMRSEISKACDIPDSFLGKILQNLAKSEILISERGKKGGFRLNLAPEKVTVYDIITAVEGDINLNECLHDEDFCQFAIGCQAHKMWATIQQDFLAHLKKYSLADISA